MVVVRYADDFVVGFEHREDAERFRAELSERLAQFGLGLKAEKTRLIEFGRYATRDRATRGLSKPETFDFLGFTHICGKTRTGGFQVKRTTSAKRMRTKLREVKDQLMRKMHLPIPEQGRWLGSVVRGHLLLRRARQPRRGQGVLRPGPSHLASDAAASQPAKQHDLGAHAPPH